MLTKLSSRRVCWVFHRQISSYYIFKINLWPVICGVILSNYKLIPDVA